MVTLKRPATDRADSNQMGQWVESLETAIAGVNQAIAARCQGHGRVAYDAAVGRYRELLSQTDRFGVREVRVHRDTATGYLSALELVHDPATQEAVDPSPSSSSSAQPKVRPSDSADPQVGLPAKTADAAASHGA